MPASSVMRISPRRGLRDENHKRGHSLESGIHLQDKDDDLALFNEAQNKERESFLLQQSDDFDDVFSTKLRYFSDYKRGISIPTRGESSDLLNAEGDKNDYDWLITPPETPLFPSLDDETPSTVAPRGRTRSQPVSIPRSSTIEKSYSSTRGSASPHRLSPSPQSGNSPLQPKSRPFSATHSSPPPTLRHPYSSRRLSPPPSKPNPALASRTPTPRRMSTGSAGATAPSRARGTSPIKSSRGNSASPKVKAWQSNIPGFSLEAPPNLRTSLADRPASYVRGTSPASRNSSRSGRQSMSPTGSRSVSSSHSYEREQFNSYSRGSDVSLFNDDVDSLRSNVVSSSDCSVQRNTGSSPNNRAMGFSKKPAKVLSSSAPKRSLDFAHRQMERKGPQNMFRPLLSSVPSSTFDVGKATVHRRLLTSRNSSITTSSNASSDQGTSGGAHDTEGSEQNQEDVTSVGMKGLYSTVPDEVFVMDQDDAAKETVDNRITVISTSCELLKNDGPAVVISQSAAADCNSQLDSITALDSVGVILDSQYSDVDAEACSKCGRKFYSNEFVMEEDSLRLCQECKSLELDSAEMVQEKQLIVDKNTIGDFVQILEDGMVKNLDSSASSPELLQDICAGRTGKDRLDNIVENSLSPYNNETEGQQEIDFSVDGVIGCQQSQQSGSYLNSKVDVSEGTGITLVLKRSSSGRGRFVQSRSFTASNTSYDDFSYMRDSLNSMRSSIGHSSASVSSSVDLGSSRQTETRIQRQSSGQKSDMENYRYETPSNHKRSVSSLSGVSVASGHTFQLPSMTPSYHEDTIEDAYSDKEVKDMICQNPHDKSLASEFTEAESLCTAVEGSDIYKSAAELSYQLKDDEPGETSVVSTVVTEDPAQHESVGSLRNNSNNLTTEELSAAHLQGSTQYEDVTQGPCVDIIDVTEVPHQSSLDAISEMENESSDIASADLQHNSYNLISDYFSEVLPSDSKACDDVKGTAVDADPANLVVIGESPNVFEDVGRMPYRSLTLEEATDSILFCRSIVHDLAYEAANIAIAKESPPPEVLRPALTFAGKSNSDRREIHSRTLGRRSSKRQKARQRKSESDTKPPPVSTETNTKSTPSRIIKSPSKGDSTNPPKLESKCNCTIM